MTWLCYFGCNSLKHQILLAPSCSCIWWFKISSSFLISSHHFWRRIVWFSPPASLFYNQNDFIRNSLHRWRLANKYSVVIMVGGALRWLINNLYEPQSNLTNNPTTQQHTSSHFSISLRSLLVHIAIVSSWSLSRLLDVKMTTLQATWHSINFSLSV